MLESKIETADFFSGSKIMSESRIPIACESASAFYDTERARLFEEREKLREQLLTNPDREEIIQEKLRQNRIEADKLERSWQTSSLNRRYIMTRTQKAEQGLPTEHYGVQERRLLAVASFADEDLQDAPKSTDNSRTMTILSGYAAKFNRFSQDLGGFKEIILPGAFSGVLKNDVRCLFNHDTNHILGRTKRGTAEIFQDNIGLGFHCSLIRRDGLGEAIAARVRRGDISGCSFAFIVGQDSWKFAEKVGDIDTRIIERIDKLFDVGPVTYPAYEDTSIGVDFLRSETKDSARFSLDDDDGDIDVVFERTLRSERERKARANYEKCGRLLARCKAR